MPRRVRASESAGSSERRFSKSSSAAGRLPAMARARAEATESASGAAAAKPINKKLQIRVRTNSPVWLIVCLAFILRGSTDEPQTIKVLIERHPPRRHAEELLIR